GGGVGGGGRGVWCQGGECLPRPPPARSARVGGSARGGRRAPRARRRDRGVAGLEREASRGARSPGASLRGAAGGAGARPLPRHALRGDRRDSRDLRRGRQDTHFPGRRDSEGPLRGKRRHMTCRDVTNRATERLTGEAGESARRELSAHLNSCEACRTDMSRLEDLWTVLGTDPDATVTPEFRRETLALLEEEMLR